MRRLRFPISIPYGYTEWVVQFPAGRDMLRVLGEPGYTESDSTHTTGGRELSWAFELEDGFRACLIWLESMEYVAVIADPPDPERTVDALHALGLSAAFEKRRLPSSLMLQRREARGSVWVFMGREAMEPSAIFSRKQLADAWLSKTRGSGFLIAYPLDVSMYDLERSLEPSMVPTLEQNDAQRYVGVLGERYEYFEGREVLKRD